MSTGSVCCKGTYVYRVQMHNVTITDNHIIKASIGVTNGGSVSISNCILWDPLAQYEIELYSGTGYSTNNKVDLSYSNVRGNESYMSVMNICRNLN